MTETGSERILLRPPIGLGHVAVFETTAKSWPSADPHSVGQKAERTWQAPAQGHCRLEPLVPLSPTLSSPRQLSPHSTELDWVPLGQGPAQGGQDAVGWASGVVLAAGL